MHPLVIDIIRFEANIRKTKFWLQKEIEISVRNARDQMQKQKGNRERMLPMRKVHQAYG